MKKYLIYIGILVAGLLIGWLFLGTPTSNEAVHNHTEAEATNQLWTCSMHPQIMQPEPGDCPICGMDLIPAETSADGLAADQFKLTKNAMALANIQTSIVGSSSVGDNALKLSGKIVENEEANAVQVSYFSGRIEKLHVNFTGEDVRKGQLLATVYSPELFAAQQELITASSLKESQPALYKAVRNKLKLWKLTEKQINQIESSGKVKENIPVYATVSGTVSEKLVEQGDYIKQGQPLFKITNLNTVWASFDVYENQINQFKLGQDVAITTNAYPNETFKAKVSFIDPILNTKTRTVKLRTVLDNKNGMFKPGMFIEGNIKGLKTNKEQLVTIPSTAVLWTGKRSVVYVKTNPNEAVFEMREVTLGTKIGDNYQVISGLDNGEEIVTNGTFTVDAAAQLQGKKSMMNKEGGKTTTGHEGHLGMEQTIANSDIDHSTMTDRIEVSSKFQEQLKTAFDAYILLKDALVKEDSKGSKDAAKSLVSNLEKIDMKLLTSNTAHTHWMSLEKEIKTAASSLATNIDIKAQRDHFKHLSSHLTTAIQLFGINQTVFSQYCPMADQNKGAFWLSLEEEVFNPYFGDAMLKCGSVKQTIK